MVVKKNRAFVPNRTFVIELEGERHLIHEKVIYLIPHGMTLGVAFELETQKEGRVI